MSTMVSSWLDTLILLGLGTLLTFFGFGAISLAIYKNYPKIEERVTVQLSSSASELYDLLDRMFRRRSMASCYQIILISTVSGLVMGAMVGLNFGILGALAFGLSMAVAGYKIPGALVRFQFQRRVEKFDRQLVDALNMMANAVKSGLSFMQVVQVIEREMPSPCREEFGMVLKENRVGVNLNDALLNMTKRMPSEDLFMIVNSVVTLSQQGGDLSEAFDTIATTIRDRQRVHDKIRTLAQAGITQGAILSAIPFFVLGMQYIIQPQYVSLLFTTPLGLALFMLMCLMILTGAVVMKKVLTIDV